MNVNTVRTIPSEHDPNKVIATISLAPGQPSYSMTTVHRTDGTYVCTVRLGMVHVAESEANTSDQAKRVASNRFVARYGL